MQALENKRPREGDEEGNPEAKVRKGDGKANKGDKGGKGKGKYGKGTKSKVKEPAGSVDHPTTTSTTAQKVEKGRVQSSQLRGRPGALRRHGLLRPQRSGDRGFPGREKEAKAKENLQKVEK